MYKVCDTCEHFNPCAFMSYDPNKKFEGGCVLTCWPTHEENSCKDWSKKEEEDDKA